MSFAIGRLTRLTLGIEGESNARPIEIDMTDWLEDRPGAAVGLLLMRPGEEAFYPAVTTMHGNLMRYVPTRADVEIPGEGLAQIVLTDANDVELRSRVVKTVVEASLPGSVVGTPEEPMQPFVDQVINAAARAEQAAKDAALHYGADDACKLLYISADGKAIPLVLGDGLQIVDGVLHVLGGGSAMVTLTVDAEGHATLNGAALTVDAEGHADITGGDIASDSSGDATIE